MATKTIKQSVFIHASPHTVYEALMDSKQHSAFTGDAAKISRKVGGTFNTFGGYAEGENLELVPDRKIVQSWRASDWPEGHFSRCTFALSKSKAGTRLTFTQTGVPDDQFESIKQGWIDYYWEPLKEFFRP